MRIYLLVDKVVNNYVDKHVDILWIKINKKLSTGYTHTYTQTYQHIIWLKHKV